MTRSEIRQILITLIACSITAAAVLFAVRNGNKKIAVVDAIQLFNSYKMKLELEGKAAGRLKFLGQQADSLKNELTTGSKAQGVSPERLEELYRSFNNAKMTFEQEYRESNQTINEQVWKRLNPLIDEYGKEQGLRLMLGANGMGNVLYNDDYYDHTKPLIEFVNKKYENGN